MTTWLCFLFFLGNPDKCVDRIAPPPCKGMTEYECFREARPQVRGESVREQERRWWRR